MYGIYANKTGVFVDGKCDTIEIWHTYGSVMGYSMAFTAFRMLPLSQTPAASSPVVKEMLERQGLESRDGFSTKCMGCAT